jgi:hypothetical protein
MRLIAAPLAGLINTPIAPLIAFERLNQIFYRGPALVQALQGACADDIDRDRAVTFDRRRGWEGNGHHV